MKAKELIKNISPFNNREEMPKALYIIKKTLAFFLVYALFVGIGEVLVIGILSAMGYDPLHGVLPAGNVAVLLKYYGFSVFFVVTLLYCKLIEKRKIKSLGFNKKVCDYFFGAVGANYFTCCNRVRMLCYRCDELQRVYIRCGWFIFISFVCRFFNSGLSRRTGLQRLPLTLTFQKDILTCCNFSKLNSFCVASFAHSP